VLSGPPSGGRDLHRRLRTGSGLLGSFNFKMPQIVVVAGKIEIYPLFLKKGAPIAHEDRMVPVRSI